MSQTTKFKIAKVTSSSTIPQVQHVDEWRLHLVSQGAVGQGTVLTDDLSAGPVFVRAGTLLRVQVAADTFFAFRADVADLSGAVSASTSPGLKLPAGYHLVVASEDYVRASVNPTRVEAVQL